MNKFCKFFAFASVMVLASCSSDEPVVDNGNEINPGEPLYLNITLRDANEIGRAGANGEKDPGTDPVTGEFDYGTDNESKVNTAHFYFFDASGKYVGQATMWNGGTASTDTPDKNIEFKAKSMVVLDNLKGTEYPTYMITVLNGPTMTDTELTYVSLDGFSKLSQSWGSNTPNGFVMTTTSYFDEAKNDPNHDNTYYYATKLTTDNFQRTPELAAGTPAVNVYVERIAARVHVTSKQYFAVHATVAGEVNGEVQGGTETAPGVAGTPLVVRVDGWYINGQQTTSYMNKQFGSWTVDNFAAAIESTATGETNWLWNSPGNHRSFWGQSVNYGNIGETLTFLPYTSQFATGAFAYCNENTTSYDDLKYTTASSTDANTRFLPNQTKLTSVIIKATVGEGTVAADGTCADFKAVKGLVEFNGTYFTYDRFKQYVLANLQAAGKLNYYKKTTVTTGEGAATSGTNTYKQVEASDFELAGDNSHVYVVATAALTAAGNIVNGNNDDAQAVTDFTQLNADLKAVNEGMKTVGFEGGAMYYNVPLAHLNSPVYYTAAVDGHAAGDLLSWTEGSFGVVRNHSYEVNINSVKRLGTGVFKPNDNETPIKPDENPEDPNWYLGATVNILSWKIVNNYVDL
ncbi:MAG: fimbria major subunit [Firmicutes bacterium]|nr:fimbria major subunit [Bacillota bacterium]MCM1401769.1 fimbria major subunit [Bacteroides sp.]